MFYHLAIYLVIRAGLVHPLRGLHDPASESVLRSEL
jgi:hypothetical protein